jgi:hypothetical protein
MSKHVGRSSKRPWLAVGPALGMLALFIALGGVADALPGANTVDGNDLRAGTVDTREVTNNSLFARDIAPGAIQDSELGTIVVREASTALPDGASGRAEATCNAGERLIGGGGATQQSGTDAIFHGSHPSVGGGLAPVSGNTFSAWNAKATNAVGGSVTVDVKAWAVCLQ